MNPFQDAFISYGRADSRDFAARLNQQLIAAGLEVWFDFDDIPLGVDYQKQIDDGIDKADNFLFIISPHAVNSSYCELEIKLALARHKRIIPLLHVEQISQATWQQRHPAGTDADWAAYVAAGKHSSFPNMHPAISKINWVYFREGVDDFEASLAGLLALLERDRDYVHQHTVLLNQALTWDKNHRLPRDLLVEAPLQQAEAWLKTEFSDRQPPCVPTKLQCQFISESLKDAQNGMTEVFLSHAEADRAAFEQVYELLARAGLTVWTSWQDIQTGVDFKAAIERGIEATNTLVYLLSPESLRSPWCQQELAYALALNKHIVPVLIKPVPLDTLPDVLKGLQFVDLTPQDPTTTELLPGRSLLNALRQDAAYYQTHKTLLVKALKWERQLRNPSILLQGQTLRALAAWLTVAQTRSQHPPLPLQVEFIEASLEQPTDIRLNAFIASDARDVAFARKLHETLQVQGEYTWFEPDKTSLGANYVFQVKEAIERAENFIIIASQDGLVDATVREELATAEALSKRIIAVSYQPGVMSLVKQLKAKLSDPPPGLAAHTLARSHLPPALADSPWVDFSDHDGDFTTNFGHLYRLLKSHPEHVRDHTRLLMRASEWEQANRDDSALLRPKETTKAEQWLARAHDQSPAPAELHKTYIQASRALAHRKVKPRSLLGVSFALTLLLLVARFFGLLQGLELAAYDHLLRQRPYEAPDDRFLMVAIDDSSGSFLRDSLINGRYAPSIGTVPDDALNEVLTRLEANGARLIGLDFYRDFPARGALAQTLATNDTLISVCKRSQGGIGVTPAPEVDLAQVGFVDFLGDRQGGAEYVRRHYLMDGADADYCNTPTAFSLLLAQRYLAQEGIPLTSPAKPEGGFRGNGLRLGEVVVPNLFVARGPYYTAADLQGYQTLLNFRIVPDPAGDRRLDPSDFAPRVTLAELLTDAVPPELIADRIVLIGYTDYTDRNADFWDTPYGDLPGVFVQGQMTSQLISAALDGRPLIHWWSLGQEILWIGGWAIAGGLMARQLLGLPRLAGALAIGGLVLYGSGYGAMVVATLWIPLIPPLLALGGTAATIALLNYRLRHP